MQALTSEHFIQRGTNSVQCKEWRIFFTRTNCTAAFVSIVAAITIPITLSLFQRAQVLMHRMASKRGNKLK
jgi:hypothetical protein